MAKPLKLTIGLGPAPEKDETEVRWLISYSDFMMQLVCLFILLYAASLLGKDKLAIVARSYRAAVGLAEPPVRPETPASGPEAADRPLAGGDLGPADVPPGLAYRVEQTRGGRIVHFEQPLFEPGSAALTPAARAVLDEAASRLRPYAGAVFVTGTAGPADGEADLMKLAQARGEAAARHLCRDGFEGALDARFVHVAGRVGDGPGVRRVRILLKER